MASHEVVLDIETSNTFQEIGAYDTSKLIISVIGVYFYETNEYRAFEVDEFKELWPRLEKAERIIGYNSIGFDIPVMNNYYPGDLLRIPQLDLMVEAQKSLGFRPKLDDIAHACLGTGKSGHGLQAVEWWRQGEKQKVKDYCLDDVKVTKAVYECGLKYKALAIADYNGTRKPVPVDFERKEKRSPLNLTMPF